jgi:acetyl esterase/lipase
MFLFVIKILTRMVRHLDRLWNIKTARKLFELFATIFIAHPRCKHEEIITRGVKGEKLLPKNGVEKRMILYLHGGAYVSGSPRTHRSLVSEIAWRAKAYALVPEYRLAPEHPHPAALDDVLKVYLWILEQGYAPSKVVVMGDSAGGGLAIALLQVLKKKGIPLPACAACLSPWTDLSCSGLSMKTNRKKDPMAKWELCLIRARKYAGDLDLKTPSLSPLFGDLSGLPPLLLQVGREEILLDDSTRLAENAKEAGTPVKLEIWENVIHVWHFLYRTLTQGQKAIESIALFVREKTSC